MVGTKPTDSLLAAHAARQSRRAWTEVRIGKGAGGRDSGWSGMAGEGEVVLRERQKRREKERSRDETKSAATAALAPGSGLGLGRPL